MMSSVQRPQPQELGCATPSTMLGAECAAIGDQVVMI